MNRRQFLRGLVAGTVAGVVASDAIAELLQPKRTIFLPPRGGWLIAANAGVPQFLTSYLDPKIIEVLLDGRPLYYNEEGIQRLIDAASSTVEWTFPTLEWRFNATP